MPSKEPVAIITHWDGIAGPEIMMGLSENGFRVAINASEQDLLMAGAPETVLSAEFNPSIEGSVKEKLEGVMSIFGRIDVLVNNPNVWTDAALAEITEAMWTEQMQQNFKPVFYCSRLLAPHLGARDNGRIINVTSTAGLTGAHTPYAVSCASIMSLTRSLAIELAPKVRVNCVATGIMDEPWIDEAGLRKSLIAKIPLSRLCRPKDVAEFVAFLALGGEFCTGQTFVVDGGEVRS